MENEKETTKWKSKDSVFVNLFEDVDNVLALYKALHPEDTTVTAKDIDIQTIKSVLVNTVFNDLGFIAKNRFLLLIEAQSEWNENISLRLMFYLAETYKRYLADTEQSEHRREKVEIPKPELYVIYTGDGDAPDETSFNEVYFGGESVVDLKVKVLKDVSTSTIYGQYIGFCKVYNEMRKIYDNKIECAKATIQRSIELGYLTEFLKSHEKEAISMMAELFDSEYLTQQYIKADRKKSFSEGEASKAIKVATKLIKRGKDTLEDIADISGLSLDKVKELAASLKPTTS